MKYLSAQTVALLVVFSVVVVVVVVVVFKVVFFGEQCPTALNDLKDFFRHR